MEREQGAALERPPFEGPGHLRPAGHEVAGLRPLAAREPGGLPLVAEPLGDPLLVLRALQAADELGAAIAEDVVIHRPRALRAEQAGDAVLAPLGEQADQGGLGGGLRGPGGDIVAGLVEVDEQVGPLVGIGIERGDHPAVDLGGQGGDEEMLLVVVGQGVQVDDVQRRLALPLGATEGVQVEAGPAAIQAGGGAEQQGIELAGQLLALGLLDELVGVGHPVLLGRLDRLDDPAEVDLGPSSRSGHLAEQLEEERLLRNPPRRRPWPRRPGGWRRWRGFPPIPPRASPARTAGAGRGSSGGSGRG